MEKAELDLAPCSLSVQQARTRCSSLSWRAASLLTASWAGVGVGETVWCIVLGGRGEAKVQNNVLYAIICISKKQTYLWVLYLCRTPLKEYSRNVIVFSDRETQGLIQQKQESVAFGWLCLKAFFVTFKITDKLFKGSKSVPGHLSFLWAPCLCLRSSDFLKGICGEELAQEEEALSGIFSLSVVEAI